MTPREKSVRQEFKGCALGLLITVFGGPILFWSLDSLLIGDPSPIPDAPIQFDLERMEQPILDAWLSHVKRLGGSYEMDGEALVVDLSDTNVDDETLFIPPVRHPIKRLDLARTAVTDKAIMQLGRLKDLEWLDLSETEVTPDGAEQLQQVLRCTIILSAGDTDGEPVPPDEPQPDA